MLDKNMYISSYSFPNLVGNEHVLERKSCCAYLANDIGEPERIEIYFRSNFKKEEVIKWIEIISNFTEIDFEHNLAEKNKVLVKGGMVTMDDRRVVHRVSFPYQQPHMYKNLLLYTLVRALHDGHAPIIKEFFSLRKELSDWDAWYIINFIHYPYGTVGQFFSKLAKYITQEYFLARFKEGKDSVWSMTSPESWQVSSYISSYKGITNITYQSCNKEIQASGYELLDKLKQTDPIEFEGFKLI